jgi:protein-S-isoprenylcysteine O-methyltransferase Ste14
MMILSAKGQHLLNHSNLRDVIIVLAIISSLAGPEPDLIGYLVPLGVLTAGCLLHFIVKGQLIHNVVLSREGTYAIVRHPYYSLPGN